MAAVPVAAHEKTTAVLRTAAVYQGKQTTEEGHHWQKQLAQSTKLLVGSTLLHNDVLTQPNWLKATRIGTKTLALDGSPNGHKRRHPVHP